MIRLLRVAAPILVYRRPFHRPFSIPPKRKSTTNNGDDEMKTLVSQKKTKKGKPWEPFDLSVPNNTTLPETLSFPEIPEGAVKIASYNVSGLNASIKKGFKKYIEAEDADIVCLQETKVNEPLSTAVDDKVYKYRYWAHDEKKGYSGTAIFAKVKPENVTYGLPDHVNGSRGRVISVFYPSFVLIGCYVPNAGEKLVRLEARQIFNRHMESYIRSLQKEGKSVIWAGDLNVAYTRYDLARPDTNERTAGFTIEERTDFSKVLAPSDDGQPALIDTWRHLHPEAKGHYTYYSYRFQCRTKRMGWRLDYFVVTPDLLDKVVESEIRQEVWGASDHVPLVLVLNDVKLSKDQE